MKADRHRERRGQPVLARRLFISAAPLALAWAGTASQASAKRDGHRNHYRDHYEAQRTWLPEPPQVPAKEGMIDVDGARLWYWDTGGSGTPVILLHAFTGSAACWGYQQPVLHKAGYRVIAYSRRGHYRSTVTADGSSIAAADLHSLAQHLGLSKFHLVGTAAGGFVALDYALSYPQQLLSLTIASSLGGVDEPDYNAACGRLLTPGLMKLPSDQKELGPSYRFANPSGQERWKELEAMAHVGTAVMQAKHNVVTWDKLAGLRVPVLLMTGNADLYSPPPVQLMMARHIPDARFVTIDDAGHSAYWEQPEAFNDALLAFLCRC